MNILSNERFVLLYVLTLIIIGSIQALSALSAISRGRKEYEEVAEGTSDEAVLNEAYLRANTIKNFRSLFISSIFFVLAGLILYIKTPRLLICGMALMLLSLFLLLQERRFVSGLVKK